MRTFLENTLKFLLPYVAVLAGVAAWALCSEIKLYRSNIRIAPDVKYVVVGDSQSAMAVDPEYFPHLANHSIAGLSLDQALYKVRDLLEVNADRDFTIILDVMPRRMLRGGWPLATADFESRYAILNFIHFFSPRRKIGEPVKLIRDRIVKDAFNSLTQRKFTKKRKKLPKKSWGGFSPRSEQRWISNPAEATQEASKFVSESLAETASASGLAEKNFCIIEEIIETVASKGKRIIMVTTPWHGVLLEKLSKDLISPFRTRMQTLAERHGIRWIDTIEWHISDEGWLDHNHLNASGAVEYTTSLRRLMLKEE